MIMRSLGEIAKIKRIAVAPCDIKAGVTYVGLEHIDGSGAFVNVGSVEVGDLASTKFAFNPDQILYGKLRPYLRKIARPDFFGVCSTDILPISPGPEIDKDYLYYYLRQPSMIKLATARCSGANLPRLTPRALEEFLIPLPTLPEQRRIAAILDKADAIRRKRQRAIQLTEEFLRSAFLEMFGDPVTNSRGWPTRKLGDIGELDRGRSKHRPRNAPELLGGPYPLIQTGDVANSSGYIKNYKSTYSELGLKQSRIWPKGTLCITIAANIAKTGILTFDACFPDSVVGFSSNALTNTEYVQYWISFLQKILEESAPESAQKNINLKILRELDTPLPPKDQQDKFANLVIKTETIKSKLMSALEHDNSIFNSLTHHAFCGELTTSAAKELLQETAVN